MAEAEQQQEFERMQELSIQRSIAQQFEKVDAIVKEGQTFRKHFQTKWAILMPLALITDACDITADALIESVVGWVIFKTISVVLTFISIMICWMTGTKQKDARDYVERLEEVITNAQENLAHYTRLSLRAGKVARHIPGQRRRGSCGEVNRQRDEE